LYPAPLYPESGRLMTQLTVSEIFYSLQGESVTVGLPTVFVRLTGCPLRCSYCDTDYAFSGGHSMGLPEILESVAVHRPRYVTVTGGEPLFQEGCWELLASLCEAGYQVSLETSGALDLTGIDPRVALVMDIKTPASGEMEQNLPENIQLLRPTDQVKFVICGRSDYLWSRERLQEWDLARRCQVLFMPAHGIQEPRELAEWILEDRLPVRFQMQLHKQLWGNLAGK
jgi:7-carboxy-7-deazaguanine synthase